MEQTKAATDQFKQQHGVSREELTACLRAIFPHGHEDYLPLAVKELELHSAKNHDYAKGGVALGNFNRVAAILALYPGLDPGDRRVVALTYALKQLDAVLWGLAKRIVHKVEGLNERLQDIAVYAKIVMCMNTEDARNKEIDRQFGTDLPPQRFEPGNIEAKQELQKELGRRGGFANINEVRDKTPEFNQTRSARVAVSANEIVRGYEGGNDADQGQCIRKG